MKCSFTCTIVWTTDDRHQGKARRSTAANDISVVINVPVVEYPYKIKTDSCCLLCRKGRNAFVRAR